MSVCEPEEIQTSSSERPSSVLSGDCRQSGCGLHAECQYQPFTDLFSCQCIRGYKVVIREIYQSFDVIIILLRVMEASVLKMRMIEMTLMEQDIPPMRPSPQPPDLPPPAG